MTPTNGIAYLWKSGFVKYSTSEDNIPNIQGQYTKHFSEKRLHIPTQFHNSNSAMFVCSFKLHTDNLILHYIECAFVHHRFYNMLLEYFSAINCHYIPILAAAAVSLLLSSGYTHLPTVWPITQCSMKGIRVFVLLVIGKIFWCLEMTLSL